METLRARLGELGVPVPKSYVSKRELFHALAQPAMRSALMASWPGEGTATADVATSDSEPASQQVRINSEIDSLTNVSSSATKAF